MTLILIGFLLFLSAIPTNELLMWLYNHAQVTRKKLDTPLPDIYFSKLALTMASSKVFQFAKGFAIPLIIQSQLENEYWLIPVMGISFALHIWSPFQKKSPAREITFFVWGVLTWLDPILGILFPCLCVGLAILINTWELAVFVNLILSVLILWQQQTSSTGVLVTLTLIGITFISQAESLFSHLEGGKLSLNHRFENR